MGNNITINSGSTNIQFIYDYIEKLIDERTLAGFIVIPFGRLSSNAEETNGSSTTAHDSHSSFPAPQEDESNDESNRIISL